MAEGRRYYGLDDDRSQSPQEKPSLFNDLSHMFSGINQTRIMTKQDRELNDLIEKYYYDPNLSDSQLDEIEKEYDRKEAEMMQTAREIQRHRDYLNSSDGTIAGIGKHALSAGSSLESMEDQYGMNLAGAGIGFALTGFNPAGAVAGWKIANIPSAIRANYRDASAGAWDAWHKVYDETGDPTLAKQAYDEAMVPNLGYAAIGTIPDIAIGGSVGKGMGKTAGKLFGEGSRVAKGAGRIARMMERARMSRLGQMGERIANKIPDIELGEGVGAWVAGKTNSTALGKGARAGAQLLTEAGSEMVEEGVQGVGAESSAARALHQYNPEQYKDEGGWSVDRVGNWLNSQEGRETMLDTAVASILTGGLATGISSFSNLRPGYNYSENLRNADNIMREIGENGIIQSNPEQLSTLKNVIGASYGLDEQQTANLSEQEVIRMTLEDATDRAIDSGLDQKEA